MSQTTLKSDMLNMQVYNLLKKDILRHKIRQGERLVDSQVAEKFGISRTPVRDALFMLVREGLVENKDKRGFYVLEVSARDIDELYDIRIMLETQAVGLVIARNLAGDPEKYTAKLREIQEKSNEYADAGDWIRADEYFHDSLVGLLGNKRVSRIFEDIRNQTRVFRQMTSKVGARVESGRAYHNRIIEAVIRRDRQQAEVILREHIEAGRREAHEDALL